MQTFLPFDDFRRSLSHLDMRRLGKQRVEAFQIWNTLVYNKTPWSKHPAVKMWKGYEDALANYYNTALDVWERRGYKNIKLQPIIFLAGHEFKYPHWLGDERFHSSHRAALMYKFPEYYYVFQWREEPKLDYYWPI